MLEPESLFVHKLDLIGSEFVDFITPCQPLFECPFIDITICAEYNKVKFTDSRQAHNTRLKSVSPAK